jgi:hypothetical protein
VIAHINWMDDGVCEVKCTCGETLTIGEESKICDNCGRKYDLIQWISVDLPLGQCRYCEKWIYGTQKKRKKYCSEDCGVKARRDKKMLTEVT